MTKEDVLALLEKSDAPVSGEQMCRALGMTRAGVWKAIEALRADGFDIEAAPRSKASAEAGARTAAGREIPGGPAHRPAGGRLDQYLSQTACIKRRAG